MATNYTSLLGFALPTTGELSGTWGTTVNDSITELVEDAIAAAATASVASGDWTLTTTGSGAANQARCAILIPTGSPGVSRNIIAPSQSKAYIVINQSNAAVVLKGAATTGVTIAAGERALTAWNGSDFVNVSSGDVDGPSSATDNAIARFDGTTGKLIQNSAVTIADTTGDITGGAYNKVTITAPATSATLTIANGKTLTANNSLTLAGTDATTMTFPSTSQTVAGLGLAQTFTAAQTFRAASAVRSEAASTQDAVVLAGRAGGTSSYAVSLTPTTLSANRTVTLADGDVTMTAGTMAVLGTAQTFTATQTFSGSTSVLGMVVNDIAEVATVSATAATGTINYDITTQSVLYYTTNASANWTVNFRASSGTSLNTAMSTGQSVTAVFMVTQGATAYYNSAVQVDGSAVTPKWQGGTAPTAGNASSIDAYVYTIIKTGAATFTVLASQTKFA
jgi:hypothetical protein